MLTRSRRKAVSAERWPVRGWRLRVVVVTVGLWGGGASEVVVQEVLPWPPHEVAVMPVLHRPGVRILGELVGGVMERMSR